MMTHWTGALTCICMSTRVYMNLRTHKYIHTYMYIRCACTPTLYGGKHIWCLRLTRDAFRFCVRARFAAEHMYIIHAYMACTIYIHIYETRIDDSAICSLSTCVYSSYINHIKHNQCNHYANINNLGSSSMCADT